MTKSQQERSADHELGKTLRQAADAHGARNFKRVLEIVDPLLLIESALEKAVILKADSLRELGRFAESIAILSEFLKVKPDSKDATSKLAWAKLGGGYHSDSIDIFESIRRQWPDNEVGFFGGGVGLTFAKRFDEADQVYLEGLRRFPQSYDMLCSLDLFQDVFDIEEYRRIPLDSFVYL
jgi:tetratricopeptide (TPR) repeat protein